MLKKLDVSRLGFYDYLKRVPSKTELRKERITKEIKKIHKESYEIYGSPKITELLNKKGEKVSQKYVYSIMKENNIKAKYIKPYIQTTVSHDFSDKLKNLLNRHYDPTKPNVAMIQDIHAELRCNNQSKTINLFSHVTKLLGNINIFDFIGIDNHSRFSNKILIFCLVQEI